MIWVVVPEGCIASDPSNCPTARGFTFKRNESSTWSDNDLYELDLYEESRIGYRGNAMYGYDSVKLGWPGDASPTLDHQVIAGFATKDVYLGQIGLDPRPVNFTTANDPQTSILQSLRDARLIPSRSWSYTAGSYNNVPKTYGSLTLGGYDSTRFVPNNLSFNFGPDISQDFLVAIQAITTDISTASLLPTGIFAPVNTLISHLWLPLDACRAFEQAFGLVWDNVTKLYLVNDDLHATLLKQKPNVTFKLGPSLTGDSVEIRMPYSSFDLTATSPLVNGSKKYFPLKRAANDSQYNLGRAFLQNAHLSADYERSKFSVSQALFPDSSTPRNLVSILPPGNDTSSAEARRRSLAAGGIAGIVVGVAAAVGILCSASWVVYRRRYGRLAPGQASSSYAKADLDAKAGTELPEVVREEVREEDQKMELEVEEHSRHEMVGSTCVHELQGGQDSGAVEASPERIYEMAADEAVLPADARRAAG